MIYKESFRGATQYQIASRSDEMSCNVHETLALTIDQDTEVTRKSLSTFKRLYVIA